MELLKSLQDAHLLAGCSRRAPQPSRENVSTQLDEGSQPKLVC